MSTRSSWFLTENTGLDLKAGSLIRAVSYGDKIIYWQITEIIDERKCQGAEHQISYASIKIRCTKVTDSSNQAFFKYFIQVSSINTEKQDHVSRANQATVFEPLDHFALKNYRKTYTPPNMSQN
ncbi:hypothetical protein N7523_008510 [Penicillium sp. IBT 18751x]|nr:hypothetical protein N7523_008510 [Penicillium sp. IBT 18751x]